MSSKVITQVQRHRKGTGAVKILGPLSSIIFILKLKYTHHIVL
jgi:hypothetical protein